MKMRHVVMAWVGETMTGHGSALCVECGWGETKRNYGQLALAAIAHDARHEAEKEAS